MLNRRHSKVWIRLAGLMLGVLIFSSCANPINRATYKKYINWGHQAENRGELKLARENYGRAFINTQIGKLTEAEQALAMYEYGRLSGYLCDFEEAEKYFKQALVLREKVNAPDFHKSQSYHELARLYYDHGQYAQAVPYFKLAIPLSEKVGVEEGWPIAFATTLDEYAVALRNTGGEQEAGTVANRAQKIRDQNPGKQPRYIPTRYNQNCP